MPAGQGTPVEQARRAKGARPEESGPALTKEVAVAQLVDRVLQVETAQQRVGSDFRRAQDIASAVGLDFGEDEELAYAAIEITPHPPVNRPQHPVHPGSDLKRHVGLAVAIRWPYAEKDDDARV